MSITFCLEPLAQADSFTSTKGPDRRNSEGSCGLLLVRATLAEISDTVPAGAGRRTRSGGHCSVHHSLQAADSSKMALQVWPAMDGYCLFAAEEGWMFGV